MKDDLELQYALMEAGRMPLMLLPAGAIAWLWDRPGAQVDAAQDLAVAANQYGSPVVDASLLKADPNVMLIKCENGECFNVYPDGGYSCNGSPMDIGGCSSILQGGEHECPMDDNGHAEVEERMGNDEHMNDEDPHAEVLEPSGLTNLAGEPTQDVEIFDDQGGDWGGPGASTMGGMGTGSPYVGDIDMTASPELANLIQSRGIGENEFRGDDETVLEDLARSLQLESHLFESNEDIHQMLVAGIPDMLEVIYEGIEVGGEIDDILHDEGDRARGEPYTLEEWTEITIQKMVNGIQRQGNGIVAHRGMTVPEQWVPANNTASLGSYWAWKIEGADHYSGEEGPRGGVGVIVSAVLDPKSIHWGDSLAANMVLPHEYELYVSNAPVKVIGVQDLPPSAYN